MFMLELPDKDFKVAIIKSASTSNYKHTYNQLKELKTLDKEIEDIKKNQMEILELENIITKLKTQWISSTTEWKGRRKRIHEQ